MDVLRRSLALVVTVTLAAGLAACSSPRAVAPSAATASPGVTRSAAASASWLSYDGDGARDGAAPGSIPRIAPVWTATLGAAVYGQPVVDDGVLVVGTEDDSVVALDARTGSRRWSASIGTPLRDVARTAGCGDVDPLGITSTPVVDPTSRTVYVVGETVAGGSVQHRLVGFGLATGRRVLDVPIDPPLPAGEHPAQLLQRPGLALANGRVYAAFGGNSGDCGLYHGWVVGVRVHGAADPVSFEAASDGEGGAIWMGGGAPAVAPDGDLYVSTGNANPDPPQGGPDPKRFTESVVRLTPDLRPVASFKDRTAGGDEDLSTGNPVLADGLVLSVGKTDIAYLLRASDLHEVAAIHGVCGSDPDGGPAFDAVTGRAFIPCRGGGVQEIDVAGRRLGPMLAGADSTPLIVGGTLWSADQAAGTLSGFAVADGRRMQTEQVGPLPHFAGPSTADGLLFIGTLSGVRAFRAVG